MERIFDYDTDTFTRKMMEMIPETLETYNGYVNQELLKSDLEMSVQFLKVILTYVKQKPKREWKTTSLLSALHDIAQTGEILYMQTKETEEEVRILKPILTNERQYAVNRAVFGGLILTYYYKVFEKHAHTDAYGKKIEDTLCRLLMVKTDVVDKEAFSIGDESPLPIQIKEHLDGSMEGQDEAKKTISMALYRFMEYGERTVIMLEGSTGVGKSFLFENLEDCELLKDRITLFAYTATQLTPNGYQGDNVEDMIKGFKRACDYNYFHSNQTERTYKGVIFIDEMDKLFMPNTDSAGEDVNKTVLAQLLTLIAGTATICDVKAKDIMFIFAGAFENVEELRRERNKKTSVGFMSESLRQDGGNEKYDLRKELIRLGAPRQFVARISHFVHLDDIDREKMRKILMNPKNGLLTQMIQLFRKDGLEIKIENDEVVEKLLDKIMESRAGVRGVREMLSAMIGSYDYDMIKQGYQIMVIHKGVLEGEKPIFERREISSESIVRVDKKARS